VLGELLAGVILGPTLLDVRRFSWFCSPAVVAGRLPLSVAAVVRVFAQLGVVVLMFLAGLETDIEMMKKTVGPAFWAASGGVILPFAGGASVARAVGFGWREAVFIGAILTATSVSITAQTLMSVNQLRSTSSMTAAPRMVERSFPKDRSIPELNHPPVWQ
jgi:Kef-type K+ transport system membrane component KefB